MGVIKMQDTKAVTVLCPYYKNTFGGQEWPNRWDNPLGPAHTAPNMRVEPNQSPRVANVLVFQDHLTKHMLVYVTPDQTAKTITKFLYGGYISIFGAQPGS